MKYGLYQLSFLTLLFLSFHPAHAQQSYLFREENAPLNERVNDLLRQLSIEEKIGMLGYNSKPVTRLNIPAYNWWNEGLHGVARAGRATVFPQAIAMAASFNEGLVQEVATVISTEARAKYNLARSRGNYLQYMGLSFWSPNINIFRDPRWGRGQETYGEDPFLTATMGMAYVRGLQGADPYHIKAAAGAKHFAVHSGPEADRHSFDAIVDEKDLRETYLYAFKKLSDAGVETIMCAYNRVNGEPCCTGNTLLRNILRNEWKFRGHVVTDCWALDDIFLRHKTLPNSVATAAAAVKAGVNLDCSNLLQSDVLKALDQKLITTTDIDSALAPLLRTQVKLGFYNDTAADPYRNYGEDSVANNYHRDLARKTAQQSMVLLKNANDILPLNKNSVRSIAIVGPNAASDDVLLGNYHGVTERTVNFVEGITAAVGAGVRIEYDQGCDFYDTVHFGGTWAASNADITVAVLGLTPVYEGEEGDAFLSRGDKQNLSLPRSHIAYLKALRKAHNKPIITVITSGSAMDIEAIAPYTDAIILAWYPGEEGGNALADIVFGSVPPSGRLPLSFYRSLDDLPPYNDYGMKGRTYRYFRGKLQYPFGFGLSYTKFSYSFAASPSAVIVNDTVKLRVKVKNTGKMKSDEVIQVYVQYPSMERMPLRELKAFQRATVDSGAEQTVEFFIPVKELQKWDSARHQWKLYPGNYTFHVGGDSENSALQTTIAIGRK